jgi:predicted TIM-barrel fold metal-dependent hydrolase
MAGVQEDWLGVTPEEALDPHISIIDPHHHLWEYPQSRYMLEEFFSDTSGGHRIEKTVFVECLSGYYSEGPFEMKPVGETEFVRALAEAGAARGGGAPSVAAGIVGFADLLRGEAAAPVLEAHIEAGGGRFRGIRHASAWDPSPDVRNAHTAPPPGLLRDEGFRRGFGLLRKYDLSFDAWLFHPQITELADLARAFPDTRIILDHVGTPLGIGPYAGDREGVYEAWRRSIDQAAACGNVTVKLGGLCMTICGFGWHRREKPPDSRALAQAMAPYLDYCIERFGVNRSMFESNFPVDKVSCGYTVLWNAFKRLVKGCSEAESSALFYNTAESAYRL